MKRLLLLFLLLSSPALGQTGSAKTTTQLNAEVNAFFLDNTSGQITPFNARQTLLDIIASAGIFTGTANTWTGLQTFTGGLNITQSPSGTQAGSLTLNNALILSTEALTGAGAFLNGQQITCGLQSAAVQGGLNCLYVTAGLNSPTSNAAGNYVAITGVGQANTGDGGTNTGAGAKGAVFATNFVGTAVSGATNLVEVTGGEVDCSLPTGTSAKLMMCWSIVSLANHAVHGASADYALAIGAIAGSVGFNGAFMLTGNNGIFPLAAGGTIMGADAAGTVAYGVDWRNITCTSNYLAFLTVFAMDCSGNITAVGNITSTAGNFVTNGNINVGAGAAFYWLGRSLMLSPADGIIELTNNAATAFTRLQLGGTTSSFPAIKRNAAALNFRLADDSADAAITSAAITASGLISGTLGEQITGAGVQVGSPTGGDKGAGTINIQNTIWTNGTQGIASRTCTVNQALTLIFTNGILTGGTCVS